MIQDFTVIKTLRKSIGYNTAAGRHSNRNIVINQQVTENPVVSNIGIRVIECGGEYV